MTPKKFLYSSLFVSDKIFATIYLLITYLSWLFLLWFFFVCLFILESLLPVASGIITRYNWVGLKLQIYCRYWLVKLLSSLLQSVLNWVWTISALLEKFHDYQGCLEFMKVCFPVTNSSFVLLVKMIKDFSDAEAHMTQKKLMKRLQIQCILTAGVLTNEKMYLFNECYMLIMWQ